MKAALEGLILECDDFLLITNYLNKNRRRGMNPVSVSVPDIATRSGVERDVYGGYRRGLVSACADITVVQRQNGVFKVPLIKRKASPFSGYWWIMGGAIFNFRSINQFLIWKFARETGLTTRGIDDFVNENNLDDEKLEWFGLRIFGTLGVARTTATDSTDENVCDTVNVCCVGILDESVSIFHDKDHTVLRYFTKEDLEDHSNCMHWYPRWAASKSLGIIESAERMVPS